MFSIWSFQQGLRRMFSLLLMFYFMLQNMTDYDYKRSPGFIWKLLLIGMLTYYYQLCYVVHQINWKWNWNQSKIELDYNHYFSLTRALTDRFCVPRYAVRTAPVQGWFFQSPTFLVIYRQSLWTSVKMKDWMFFSLKIVYFNLVRIYYT